MVVGDPVRFSQPTRLVGRKLPRVLAVRTVVDDRPDAGFGERLDIGTVELAGGADPRSEGSERWRNGRHLRFSGGHRLAGRPWRRLAPRRRRVIRKIRAGGSG